LTADYMPLVVECMQAKAYITRQLFQPFNLPANGANIGTD